MARLNKEDRRRLEVAYSVRNWFNNNLDEIASYYGYSGSSQKKIHGLFNKMVQANLTGYASEKIINGKFGASAETVKFYIEYIGKKGCVLRSIEFGDEVGADVYAIRGILLALSLEKNGFRSDESHLHKIYDRLPPARNC